MLRNLPQPTWLTTILTGTSGRSGHLFRIFVLVAVIFIVTSFLVFDFHSTVYRQTKDLLREKTSSKHGTSTEHVSSHQPSALEAAGNSTLGFSSIQFINLKNRFDRLDAATLQAYLSRLDIVEVPGVEAKDIHDKGMPPTHRLGVLRDGEKGCWRAHANIWSQMLRDKSPAVLIIESDAAWDVNVRDIMTNLNVHFTRLLDQRNSKPIHDGRWNAAQAAPEPSSTHPLQPNRDDPWHSAHWDMLSLGQCFESSVNSQEKLAYPDEHVPEGKDYFGTKMGHERVVRLSGGIVCTTAYAISQTGAAKLLLRSAVDLDNPVDLLMRRMTLSGDLIVYSVLPTVFAQWEYANNIGMKERGANSDINGGKTEGEINMDGWSDVKKTGSVWQDKEGHPDVAFDNMALEKAWSLIMPQARLEESQFHEDEGN
ncbi:hypothetical protein QQS21_004234 [Conoideocrella luteorostrata]|uniref:Glycosyl transferase family 25 domain-containing protein n=1 Tax=Conoideocrella luteorostrata TaxID=1105319 RepID=A0AAJ0CRP0_9HYPO|nr:hypothetical protein QQS21_004234 [Conoideocrella luteorostrata]